jgi:hypothetical protein
MARPMSVRSISLSREFMEIGQMEGNKKSKRRQKKGGQEYGISELARPHRVWATTFLWIKNYFFFFSFLEITYVKEQRKGKGLARPQTTF